MGFFLNSLWVTDICIAGKGEKLGLMNSAPERSHYLHPGGLERAHAAQCLLPTDATADTGGGLVKQHIPASVSLSLHT